MIHFTVGDLPERLRPEPHCVAEMPLRILANRDAEADGAGTPPPATPSKRATERDGRDTSVHQSCGRRTGRDRAAYHQLERHAGPSAPSAVVLPAQLHDLFPAVDGTKGAQLEVIRPDVLLFDEPDAVGAFLIHAITVANTDDNVS